MGAGRKEVWDAWASGMHGSGRSGRRSGSRAPSSTRLRLRACSLHPCAHQPPTLAQPSPFCFVRRDTTPTSGLSPQLVRLSLQGEGGGQGWLGVCVGGGGGGTSWSGVIASTQGRVLCCHALGAAPALRAVPLLLGASSRPRLPPAPAHPPLAQLRACRRLALHNLLSVVAQGQVLGEVAGREWAVVALAEEAGRGGGAGQAQEGTEHRCAREQQRSSSRRQRPPCLSPGPRCRCQCRCARPSACRRSAQWRGDRQSAVRAVAGGGPLAGVAPTLTSRGQSICVAGPLVLGSLLCFPSCLCCLRITAPAPARTSHA